MPSSYALDIIKAEDLEWTPGAITKKPSPYVEVSLNDELIYTSFTQERTLDPVWEEEVEIKPESKTSKLTFAIYHDTWGKKWGAQLAQLAQVPVPGAVRNLIPAGKRPIGSADSTIEDLLKKGAAEEVVSLDLFEDGVKTAVLKISFGSADPTPPDQPDASAFVVPPELRPDFVAPSHPTSPGSKLQIAGFRNKPIEVSQVERMVEQVLSRNAVEVPAPA